MSCSLGKLYYIIGVKIIKYEHDDRKIDINTVLLNVHFIKLMKGEPEMAEILDLEVLNYAFPFEI